MNKSELANAVEVLSKAASRGFEWDNVEDVLEKLGEEFVEAVDAIESGDRKHIEEEIGDVLFAAANVARFMNVDADKALAAASAKFERRFARMQEIMAEDGKVVENTPLNELVEYWKIQKASE